MNSRRTKAAMSQNSPARRCGSAALTLNSEAPAASAQPAPPRFQPNSAPSIRSRPGRMHRSEVPVANSLHAQADRRHSTPIVGSGGAV